MTAGERRADPGALRRRDARPVAASAPEPLRVPVADSHCHLDIADPPEDWLDVDAALAASAAVGVPRHRAGRLRPRGRAVGGGDGAAVRRAWWPASRCTPTRRRGSRPPATLDAALAEIDALAADPRVRAVGETGLDYFRTGEDGRGVQQDGRSARTSRWRSGTARRW